MTKGELVAIPQGKGEPSKYAIETKAEKPKSVMGRPTIYSEDLRDEICERIALGESVREIIKDDDMPEMRTIFRWLKEKEDFRQQYTRAKEEQADAYEEMMLITARTEEDVARARLIVDTMKWTASKLKPKKYGDKVDVTSDGEKLGVAFSADQAEQLIRARASRSDI